MIRAAVIIGSIIVISFVFGAFFTKSELSYAATSDEKWGQQQTLNEITEKAKAIKGALVEMTLEDKVNYYADKHGINRELAQYVVKNESHYNEQAVGDLFVFCPKDNKPVFARGSLQITRCYHPEISDDCAFDADCALDTMLPMMKDKKTCKKEWTTCRWFYQGML